MKTLIVPHTAECRHDTAIVEGDTLIVCESQMPVADHRHDWFRDFNTNDPNQDTWTCTQCLVTTLINPEE